MLELVHAETVVLVNLVQEISALSQLLLLQIAFCLLKFCVQSLCLINERGRDLFQLTNSFLFFVVLLCML